MDEISAFATIVGLLGQFSAERSFKGQLEFNDFLEWLVKANHTEVKKRIEENTVATLQIQELLRQDHKKFQDQLHKLNDAITAYASGIAGFDKLADSINPNSVLSKQAISILHQIQKSGATKIMEIRMHGGTDYIYAETDGGLEIEEERFVEDDLKTLVEKGLLRHEFNSKGENIYVFTRAASRLVSV